MSIIDRAHLVTRVLPYIRRQPDFALKGGTAINLFYRDLPRYSVDIDLIFLPSGSYKEDLVSIHDKLDAIAKDVRDKRIPSGQIVSPGPASRGSPHIYFRHSRHRIKVEVSPVWRGAVWPSEVRIRRATQAAEQEFGFLESQVASFEEVYAGKICAALDRQRPRDLFDIKELLAHEGINRKLLQTFLVYLISSNRQISDLLRPRRIDISKWYEFDLKGMARGETSEEELVAAGNQLIQSINSKMTHNDREFLMSVQSMNPDWSLIGIPSVDRLPAVQRKIDNLANMRSRDHDDSIRRLDAVLNDQNLGSPSG